MIEQETLAEDNPINIENGDNQVLLRRVASYLADARSKLVDRNLRNKLINTALQSSRSSNLKIHDELSNQVFECLLADKKAMIFKGVPDKNKKEVDLLDDSLFDYTPEEVEVEADPNRHNDSILQTKITTSSLEKKLRALYYESSGYEEEQGVNILYLSLGFLKWYEDINSNVERFAPLILLPVQLIRDGAKERYQLKIRDEDLFTNVSLKLWLKEQHSIDLPDLPEDEELSPSRYFDLVRDAISNAKKWEVLDNEILLGFFSFSKFLLWRDLDPENWPVGMSLLNHPTIQKLLGSSAREESIVADPPIVPAEDLIDDHFTPHQLVYVLDADSSQTEAIQTSMAGKDLVIQGPPGTGKSQTITNIISSAIHQGKKVLFVAEKMAALEVVHNRLKHAGLGSLCFELHSRKSSKSAVLEQLREALELGHQSKSPVGKIDLLKKVQDTLNSHAKRLNQKLADWDFSPFEVLGLINKLSYQGLEPTNFDIPNASTYTKTQLNELILELEALVDRLVVSGIPNNHPWRLSSKTFLSPLDVQRLGTGIAQVDEKLDILIGKLKSFESYCTIDNEELKKIGPSFLNDLTEVSRVLLVKPGVSKQLLCSNYLRGHLDELEILSKEISELSQLREDFSSIFLDGWEKRNMFELRVKLAGSGGSFFSFLNKSYRESVGELRGISKSEIPKKFADRLKLVDKACNFIKLTESILLADSKLTLELGDFWSGTSTDSLKLKEIVSWYKRCANLSEAQFKLLIELYDLKDLKENIDDLNDVMASKQKELAIVSDLAGFDLNTISIDDFYSEKSRLGLWQDNLSRFNEWPAVRDKLLKLAVVLGEKFHRSIYFGETQAKSIVNLAQITIYEKIWCAMVEKLPELASLDGQTLSGVLNQFRELDTARLKIASDEVLTNYIKTRPNGFSGDMGVIRQELNKKKRHMAVRKLISEAGGAIQELKPVFLMSPISLAQYIAPGSIIFDLIIIDEASQIRPEDALGAIARAKQIVVVGDDKQLPPTNFFNRITDDEASLQEDDADFAISNLESILSLCNIAVPNQAMLRWHYRSQHPGLIAVSNRNFYDNQLLLPPSTLIESYFAGMGVSMIKSPQNSYERGGANGGRNIVEADLIAQAVIDCAKNSPHLSLGVATFSVRQRDAVRDLIDNYRRKNPELESFFSTSKEEHFFVKNLESIQGDERDVIFISVGYGRDQTGRLTQTFGPLGQDGGERRLNVLISRAKLRCTVFSSITAEDIKEAPGKLGVNAFKEFLQYAEKGYFDVPVQTNKDFDSDFEESVAIFLRKNGYKLQPQVGMAGFFIDIGVIDPNNPNKYICGIECDGATYHSSRSARDRDRIRQNVLESRGWNIYRIWSTDWFHRRVDQEQRLLDYLRHLTDKNGLAQKDDLKINDVVLTEDEIYSPSLNNVEDLKVVPYQEYEKLASIALLPHQVDISTLVTYVTKIVGLEGPIHEEEVARRLAKVFGLEKAGSRIQELARAALVRAKLKSNKKFWSSDNLQGSLKIRDRRAVKSKTLLQASYLPHEEILEALIYLVSQNVRIEEGDLFQGVTRLFGFNRAGPDLKKTIADTFSENEQKFIRDAAGFIKLKK